jgi:hypothetical protein
VTMAKCKPMGKGKGKPFGKMVKDKDKDKK